MARRYWLFKSEPDVFGWDHLRSCPDQTTHWDGVRNYQARNLLRDEIQEGDLGFFYHSRTTPPHIVGTVEVTRAGYPDPTQFDPKAKYFDPKSNPEAPRWYVVDVRAAKLLPRVVSLEELKQEQALSSMMVVQKGARLSVQPVTAREWEIVIQMAGMSTIAE
ncbi:MAG: EVE domain-containing protein [Myxococcales bacterium]|nr:EVE domain-containing protein [Myxococcales bacterium]